jgi:hypothetical protein
MAKASQRKGRIEKLKSSPAAADLKKVGNKVLNVLGIPENTEPKKPRAKFGSGEGKFFTALGMAPSQVDAPSTRSGHLMHGITEANIASVISKKPKSN